MREYNSFEDALHSFVCDFHYGKTYGLGIYDREAKVLYIPIYFNEGQCNWVVEEIGRLGYEIEKVQYFDALNRND